MGALGRLQCIGYIIFLTLAAGTAGAGSGDSLSAKEQPPLKFVIAAVPPWSWEEDGEKKGLLVDLVEALKRKTDLPIEYHLRPHSRAILELGEGEADYSILFRSPRSEQIGEAIATVVRMNINVVGRLPAGDDAPRPRSLDDLSGQPVGYIRGTYYGDEFLNHPGIDRVAVNDMAHGMMLMGRGRLDAMVGTEIAFSQVTEPDYEVFFQLGDSAGNIYFSRRSDRRETLDAIRDAAEALRQEGVLEDIFGAEFAPDDTRL